MAEKITFDGLNKYIYIHTGVTEINVQLDMYSPWKDWMQNEGGAKWLPTFNTFGGDPTSESQFAPRYFFLINNWKVWAEDIACTVQTNLYSDDGLSPFIVTNAAVTNRTSDVPVIKSDLEQRLDYGDKIYYDETSPYTGIEYPVGTIAQPVNNAFDAIALANLYNIGDFYCLSDVNLPGITGQTFECYSLFADKENLTATLYGNTMNNTDWHNFNIDGDFQDGTNKFYDCIIENALNTSGQFKSCQINGIVKVSEEVVMSACYSGVAGAGTPIYDMNSGKTTRLSIRSYSGGVQLINCDTSGCTTTVELIAGQIKLEPTCSDGYIDLRGVGYLTNNVPISGATVKTTGFIDSFEQYVEETREIDEILAYDGVIYYDSVDGFTGTTYPIGTVATPVDNIFDLFYLSQNLKIKNIVSKSNFIVSGFTSLASQYTIKSDQLGNNFYMYDGNNVENLTMVRFNIHGDFKGVDHTFTNCELIDVYGLAGEMQNCDLEGILGIQNNTTFSNCHPSFAGGRANIIMTNTGGTKVSFRDYSGSVNFDSVVNENDTISIDLNAGHITFTSGCTNGIADVRGVGYVTDNSLSGFTVKREGQLQATPYYYDDTVILDTVNGEAGIIYPIGSIEKPVNNISDALIILNTYGLHTIKIVGSYTIDNGEDLTGIAFTAERSTGNMLIINSAITDHTYISNLTTIVTQTGTMRYTTSVLVDIDDFDGGAKDCLLIGNINIVGNGSNYFTNCDTYTTDITTLVSIDVGDKNLNIIRSRGFYKIVNKTSSNDITIDMVGGKIEIDSTCVDGQIYIAGICEVIDNSSSGCTIIRDSQLQASPGEFDGVIVIDTIDGIVGTEYPIGTTSVPVNNLTDALTLLDNYSLNKIKIVGTLNIDNGEDLSEITFTAERSTGNYLFITDAITNDTYIENLTTSVVQNGSVRYTTCVLGIIENFDGGAKNCLLTNDINIVGSGLNYLTDCDVYMIAPDSPVTIDQGWTTLNLIRCRGGYEITNKTSTNTTAIDMVAGIITVDSSCVAGSVFIGGICEVVDNSSAGCDVQVKSMSHEAISQNVWDEVLNGSTHNLPTSAGRRLRQLSAHVIWEGTSQGAAVNGNQIILDEDAADYDGAYDPAIISITEGTGIGQTRLILEYSGTTRTATVDRNWRINPDDTSIFIIVGNPGREHVNEGLIQSGTTNTVTLNKYASSLDDTYNGQVVFIRSGLGEDQAQRVLSYNGTTKVATISSDWAIIPDTTSAYVMLPTATATHDYMADAVWDSQISEHTDAGSTGDALNNVSAGASPELIAGAVWSQQMSGFTTPGTAGYQLAGIYDAIASTGSSSLATISEDVKRILGLTQENFRTFNQVYDADDLLQSADIRIYTNAADCDANTNPLESYSMTALYDGSGRLTDYKVTKD